MRVLRWLGIGIAAVVGLFVALLVGARFADGPLGLVAGGPLVAGEWVEGEEPDWSFARDVDTIEFQLLDPARSRTTWILEHEGQIYVPCGYMNTNWGRIWKRWPIEAERDGRAVVRIEGKRYPRVLERVRDPKIFSALAAEIQRKYGVPVPPDAGRTDALWIFALAPPS
ncbi:MAG: hypothetical protein MJE66_23025 [Proteobacteria bacterium]|nr:hypothetical protein [Pseudomonadota bacterium]